jgi:hypothetical protein
MTLVRYVVGATLILSASSKIWTKEVLRAASIIISCSITHWELHAFLFFPIAVSTRTGCFGRWTFLRLGRHWLRCHFDWMTPSLDSNFAVKLHRHVQNPALLLRLYSSFFIYRRTVSYAIPCFGSYTSWFELIGNKCPSDFCRFQIADLPDGLGFCFYMRLIEASQDVGNFG